MNKSEALRLINKHIDGDITKVEQESLDQVLTSDENVHYQFENMQKTVDAIESLPSIDPPASLTNDILNKIDSQRYQKPIPFWQRLSLVIFDFGTPRRQVAMAFISGLIIGACCIGLISNYESLSNTDLTGSIGVDQNQNIQHFTMKSTDLTGEFNLKKLPSGLSCQVNVNTKLPFVLLIEFDSPEYYLTDYKSISGDPVFVQSASGQIQLTANTGSEIRLMINGPGTSGDQLSLKITSQEESLSKTILF